ncbi:hypothetical protein RQP46_001647 [Phenoliferia psychrophenolica]
MGIPHFPNEILLAIISLIPPSDHSTLHSCQLTSRAFREFSTPILYGHIDISWTADRGPQLLATLRQNLSLASVIRSAEVDFPRFEDLAQLRRRRDEIISRARDDEEAKWPARLEGVDLEEHESYKKKWTCDFEENCVFDRNRALWDEAEEEAWAELTTKGMTRWLQYPRTEDDESSGERRAEGSTLLAGLIASLPNLRHLEFSNYDDGITALPELKYLDIENFDSNLMPPFLPSTPNVEMLVIGGSFDVPSELHVAKLHTLYIHSRVFDMDVVLPRMIEASKATLETLGASYYDVISQGDAGSIANAVAEILPTVPGLKHLTIPQHRYTIGVEDLPTFTSYLAQSALCSISLPFRPSPLLFVSLPPTIEQVTLTEPGDADGPIDSLDSLLLEKARLPRLVRVEMRGCWRDVPGASDTAQEKAAVEQERVLQGRLLGVEIVLN